MDESILVFDIETVPDVEAGRLLYQLEGLGDEAVAEAMMALRRQSSYSGTQEFMPHHLQRVVAISVVLRVHDSLKVWSLGEPDSEEPELLQRFFQGVERYTPTLVSWNGGGFDLPVLHYRSLIHGVVAQKYWEYGESDQEFRFNNYLNRYHYRHTDLMECLAGFISRANARLDEVATLLGLPGKMGMDGSKVWERFLLGDVVAIRNYCETDVLNTYLVYLRFQLIRGRLSAEHYAHECDRTAELLAQPGQPFHLSEFLNAWRPHGS